MASSNREGCHMHSKDLAKRLTLWCPPHFTPRIPLIWGWRQRLDSYSLFPSQVVLSTNVCWITTASQTSEQVALQLVATAKLEGKKMNWDVVNLTLGFLLGRDEEMSEWISEEAQMSGGQETVGRKFSLISHKDLLLLAEGQTVLSGGEEWNQSRGKWEGESGKDEGRRSAFWGEQGLRLGVIQLSRSGGEARKTLSLCQSVKRYFLSFFPPFFPFLMCPCVRREEGIVMGIWCQTSKPFYSLREPPGQNIELGPPGVSRQETRQSAEVLSCSESVAWTIRLVFQPVFIPRISYSTLNGTEIVRFCQLYLYL